MSIPSNPRINSPKEPDHQLIIDDGVHKAIDATVSKINAIAHHISSSDFDEVLKDLESVQKSWRQLNNSLKKQGELNDDDPLESDRLYRFTIKVLVPYLDEFVEHDETAKLRDEIRKCTTFCGLASQQDFEKALTYQCAESLLKEFDEKLGKDAVDKLIFLDFGDLAIQ